MALAETCQIDTVRLDDLAAAVGTDFIKLDVQAAERDDSAGVMLCFVYEARDHCLWLLEQHLDPEVRSISIVTATSLRHPDDPTYRTVLTCHNSGNSTTSSMRRKYGTPPVPPVPRLNPMTRSTVVTWLNRQRRK